MKCLELDEAYLWMPNDAAENKKALGDKFRSHFARVPDELFARYKAAWDEVNKLAREIDKYQGTDR